MISLFKKYKCAECNKMFRRTHVWKFDVFYGCLDKYMCVRCFDAVHRAVDFKDIF
jgi:hypothetical protein